MTPEEQKEMLEQANALAGFNQWNGIKIADVGEGTSVIEVPLTEHGVNPWGTAHGGLIFTICDVAAGVAARSRGRKQSVSQDASIYFLRPGVNTEKLTAKGRVIREGGSSAYAEAEAFADDGTLIAKAGFTVHFVN